MAYVNSTKVIFGDISRTEERYLFSETSASRLTSISCSELTQQNGGQRGDYSFVDKNDFVKEGKWYFLNENSQWDTVRTSGETYVCFRLKLKIT